MLGNSHARCYYQEMSGRKVQQKGCTGRLSHYYHDNGNAAVVKTGKPHGKQDQTLSAFSF